MARAKSKVNEARKEYRKSVRAVKGKTSGIEGARKAAQKARKAANARIAYQLKKADISMTPEQAGISMPKIKKGATREELKKYEKTYRSMTAEKIQQMIKEDVVPAISYRSRYKDRLMSVSPYIADQFDNAMSYVLDSTGISEEQLEEVLSQASGDIDDIEWQYNIYKEKFEEGAEHAAQRSLNKMLKDRFGVG